MATPTSSIANDNPLKLENQLCFPLYALSRTITKAYQPHLLALGLTYPQYLVFLLLWEQEPLTVKEIGEKLLLDSGTLTPLLKRMEQKQWVSRQRDPHDERSVVIRLLPAGQALQAQACQIPEQILAKLQMGPAEFAALRTQLNLLLSQLT